MKKCSLSYVFWLPVETVFYHIHPRKPTSPSPSAGLTTRNSFLNKMLIPQFVMHYIDQARVVYCPFFSMVSCTYINSRYTLIEQDRCTTKCCLCCPLLALKCLIALPPLHAALQALGMDCEWVGTNPIALIQLSTHTGFCVLVRVQLLPSVPESLKVILNDKG